MRRRGARGLNGSTSGLAAHCEIRNLSETRSRPEAASGVLVLGATWGILAPRVKEKSLSCGSVAPAGLRLPTFTGAFPFVSWVKLDDHMADHPKVARLGDFAPLAIALQVRALCYCARYLTDGVIPHQIVPQLLQGFSAWGIETGGVPGMYAVGQDADDFDWPSIMLKSGLWDRKGRDFVVHDYLEYNPSRQEVLKERERNAQRQQQFRRRNAVTNSGSNGTVIRAPAPTPNTESKTTTSDARASDSWLTPLADIWVAQYHGSAPFGQIGRYLKRFKDHPDLIANFRAYVAATGKEYVSIAKFAQTFGSWSGNGHEAPQTFEYTPGVTGPAL